MHQPRINRCVRVQGAPGIKPTVSMPREFISADSSLPDNDRQASRKREREKEEGNYEIHADESCSSDCTVNTKSRTNRETKVAG